MGAKRHRNCSISAYFSVYTDYVPDVYTVAAVGDDKVHSCIYKVSYKL